MTFGDGIRRNIAHVEPSERALLRDAFLELNRRFFPGDRTDETPGGVSWWFKQDEIHQATHVHGGPEFLPWHREIVNRLEEMLRQINPQLSLHYWDWTQDPREIPNANLGGGVTGILDLFTPDFMGWGGTSPRPIGMPWQNSSTPWRSDGYYVPGARFNRDSSLNPADPPALIQRSVGRDGHGPVSVGNDEATWRAGDYAEMRALLERSHDRMHDFVSMGDPHISFRDPFVFLLHSNVDRLFARWQTDPEFPERLVPATVYGSETDLNVEVFGRIQNVTHEIQPWSGGTNTRPWAFPENQQVTKDYQDPSVVVPPLYDTNQQPVWRWANRSKPEGVNISGPVGVLTVMDNTASAQRLYAFVRGSDENLWINWWTGSAWNWASQGKPADVSIVGSGLVLTVMDTPTSSQRPYTFVRGSDGNLWTNWWTGSAWSWANQRKPADVGIGSPLGVLTVMDTPISSQRPYTFVQDNDGSLWVNWWTGSAWRWDSLGVPPDPVNVHGPGGVLTVKDTPASSQRPYVFMPGNDANLWVNWWTGSAWRWDSLGRPEGVSVRSLLGVLTVMDSPTSAQRPHAFVLGNDGNLWVNSWTGEWRWSNLGKPSDPVSISSPVGVVTVMDTPISPQRPYVFVLGSDGNLWVNSWTGGRWTWANQGKPVEENISGSVGVLTVMDTPMSPQRPHVFVRGSDGNLWINWWG